MQEEYTKINETAWNQMAYEAWVNRFGTPHEAATKLKLDPIIRLGSLYRFFGSIKGKKIANLLGSNGNKAVALALLGAEVTVVDFASENARYGGELALESGVNIRYVIEDVLKLSNDELTGDYDVVFTEMGILHYFLDLKPFMKVISMLLKKGGKLILQDFHPVSTKLITSKGKKHKVTGDYFDKSIEIKDVAYMKFVGYTDEEKATLPKVRLRKWTLGEIITSVAEAGLFLNVLEEDEGVKPDDKGIPKTFILIATNT